MSKLLYLPFIFAALSLGGFAVGWAAIPFLNPTLLVGAAASACVGCALLHEYRQEQN